MKVGQPRLTIHENRKVQLLGNVCAFFQQEAVDFAAFGTGLMRDQGLADQFFRKAGTSRLILGDFDAPGFSPPAGMNLRFDDEDRGI